MRAITVAVLLSVVLTVVYQPVFFSRWDQKAKDLLTAWAGGGKLSNRVVIVAVDDGTLAQFGRWPWSRDRLSELLQAIQQAGPDTVVLDMMFPEADLAKPAVPVPRRTTQPSHAREAVTNDDLLAATLQEGRFVVGFHLKFSSDQTDSPSCQLKPLRLTTVETERTRGPAFFIASGVSCSVDKLSRASLADGFLNAAPDRDGVLRRIPLVAQYQGSIYPSLALAGYVASRRIHDAQLWTNSAGARSLRLDGVQVPVDSRAGLLLRFRNPAGQFPRVSAAAVMNGKAPQEALRDKVVVVGMTAQGLQDVVATPIDPLLPGVEAQATAIDNLIQRDPYSVPRGALAGELALLFIMGIASGLLISRVGVIWAPLAVGSLLLATWVVCAVIVTSINVVVSPFPATTVLLGNLALLSTSRVVTEKRREEQQLRTTRQFILHILTSLTRIRDLETGAHIMRVQRYAKILSETIALDGNYRHILTPKTIQLIYELIPVHDIGKVAVPDRILRHPGRLDPEEYEIIKTHVTLGHEVFADAVRTSGLKDEAALRLASDIILTHHEHWNGGGYPRGLTGENIPLVGRIAAVADVYDALVCKRVYKEGWRHEAAVEFIVTNRGIIFDPVVVDAFVKVEKEIQAIKMSFDDETAITDERTS